MILPSLTSWRAQHGRLKRAYQRILQPYQSSVAHDDDLQSFCQTCWNLKDWIKNDPGAGVGNQIKTEVDQHRVLRVIGDLANGSKHLVRNRHDREGAYATSTNVNVHLGQRRAADIEYIIALAGGSTLEAQEVVREAFVAWQTVLTA